MSNAKGMKSSATTRILVLRHDDACIECLDNLSTMAEYEVSSVTVTVEDMLDQCGYFPPDLVLLELDLERDSEIVSVASRIQKKFYIPVIYLLNQGSEALIQDKALCKPFGAVFKEYSHRELGMAIKAVLYSHRMELEYAESLKANIPLVKELAKENARMALISETLQHIRGADIGLQNNEDLGLFYHKVVTDLMALTRASYGAFGIVNDRGEMKDFITHGKSDEVRERMGGIFQACNGFLKEVFYGEDSLRVDDIGSSAVFNGFPNGHPGITSLIGYPIKINGQPRGSIYLANKNEDQPFTKDDETILEMYGSNTVHALERHDLTQVLKGHNDNLQSEKDEQQILIKKLQDAYHHLEDAQGQLLQSEKMASIGQLAAGVAHEINNPVGYVFSNVATLQKNVEDMMSVIDAYGKEEVLLEKYSDNYQVIQALKKKIDLDFLKQDVLDLVQESRDGLIRVSS